FAAEILYRDAELESEVLMPAFVASSVAYCVFCGGMGRFGSLFQLGAGFEFQDVRELLPYRLLALALLPVIAFFTPFFYGGEHAFARLPGPRALVAALGGLLTGGVGLGAMLLLGDQRALSLLSTGYGVLQQALDGGMTGWPGARLLLAIALLKVVTATCT